MNIKYKNFGNGFTYWHLANLQVTKFFSEYENWVFPFNLSLSLLKSNNFNRDFYPELGSN